MGCKGGRSLGRRGAFSQSGGAGTSHLLSSLLLNVVGDVVDEGRPAVPGAAGGEMMPVSLML